MNIQFTNGICDNVYPIHEWDKILHQCEITLNLLRNTRTNPKLSSWAFLNGPFDFNKTPLTPPGTKIEVHTKPNKRASWAYHSTSGWYVGPALAHYRCLKCYIPATRVEIISDTIIFIPNLIPIPEKSLQDDLKMALEDITNSLNAKNTLFPGIQNDTARQSLCIFVNLLQPEDNDILLQPSELK